MSYYRNALLYAINEAFRDGLSFENRRRLHQTVTRAVLNEEAISAIMAHTIESFGTALIDASRHIAREYNAQKLLRIDGNILFSFAKELYTNWDYLFQGRRPWPEEHYKDLQHACIAVLHGYKNAADCMQPKVQRVKIRIVRKPGDHQKAPTVRVTVCADQDEHTEKRKESALEQPAYAPVDEHMQENAPTQNTATLQLKPYKVRACSIVNGELTIFARNEEDAMLIASGVKPTYDQTELWQNFTAISEHPHIEICGEYGDDVIAEG